jgi:hypothetical protein
VADGGRGNAPGQPDRMLKALRDFREVAEAAAVAWGQDITVQQGLDIAWMLSTVIRGFRVATGLLGRYEVTVDPGDDAAAPGDEIKMASWSLDAARDLAMTGEAAMKQALWSNLKRGVRAGGDPDADGPAVAAVHGMVSALGVSEGVWRSPAGTWEARDEVVAEMMRAMRDFGTAVLTLAERSPEPFHTSFTEIARVFDFSTECLRESLIVYATGNYQPGTEPIADAVRAAHPLRSMPAPGEPASGSQADGDGAPAAALARESFPAAADAPAALRPAGPDGPASEVAARRPAAGNPGRARKGP